MIGLIGLETHLGPSGYGREVKVRARLDWLETAQSHPALLVDQT